ncbi:hypothetical protein NT6N_21010 [Oceaniferula spumae]|uniref:Aspartyl protease n=1 Tax=Oceaniferula spumae TaxID=2979115 RepID=A0AAT9FM23_9BACT
MKDSFFTNSLKTSVKWITRVAAFCLLALPLSAKPGKNIDEHFTSIPLITGNKFLRYVQTDINGTPYLMMLDSGADKIFIAQSVATKLKIKTFPYTTAKGTDGKLSAIRLGPLKTFKVGDLVVPIKNACFANFPHLTTLKFPDGSTKPSAGQLGTGFIHKMHVAVDYPGNRLLVPKKPDAGNSADLLIKPGDSSVPMIENKSGRHYIQATLNGKPVLFLADTAASSCVLFKPAAKAFKIPLLKRKASVDTFNSDNATVGIANVSKLELGGKNRGTVQMLVMPHSPKLKSVQGMPVVGLLGASLFEAFHATIDFSSNKLILAK